jgi:hypothetical protein
MLAEWQTVQFALTRSALTPAGNIALSTGKSMLADRNVKPFAETLVAAGFAREGTGPLRLFGVPAPISATAAMAMIAGASKAGGDDFMIVFLTPR